MLRNRLPFKLPPASKNRFVYLALIIVIGFGLMLRLVAFTQSEVPTYPRADAAKYFTYAYNLRNFGVYGKGELAIYPADADPKLVQEIVKPDALVTPGLPLFLSLFLGGDHTEGQRDAILFTQVLLSTATILLVYLAFAPLGKAYALCVASLTALSPHLVNLNLHFLTEPLFTFLLSAFVFVLSRAQPGRGAPYYLALGAVLALASLTRPWVQGFLILLVAWFALSSFRLEWKKALLIVVGTAVLITPWLIRNQVSLGFMADPTLSGRSIHHGMYPDMMFDGDEKTRGYAYDHDPMSAQMSGSPDATMAELKRRVGEDPATYANWYLFGKTRTVLSWAYIAGADAVCVYPVGNSPYFRLPSFYLSSYYMEKLHGILMALALVGTLLVWLPSRMQPWSGSPLFFLRALSLFVVYFVVMHSIGAPYPRYSVPMRPVFYGLALYPLFLLGTRLGRKITAQTTTS